MRRDSIARALTVAPPRSAFLRGLPWVCACEACCQAQPWRREAAKRRRGELQRGPMREAWREMR